MRTIALITLIFLWALSPKSFAQDTFRVMVDAGHGGKDNGTTGAHSVEKDIVLEIATKLSEMSSSQIEIILTRQDDEFIKLNRRADMANESDVDLFISLHCNHISHSYVHGTEVYVHGSGHTHEDRNIAERENGGLYEEDEVNENMSFILNEIAESAYLEQSLTYGNQVVSSFNSSNTLHQRGLRQANFRVLRTLDMPGVLIELAYLSNAKNEEYISSEKGKTEVVEVLWNSIVMYRNSLPQSSQLFLVNSNK